MSDGILLEFQSSSYEKGSERHPENLRTALAQYINQYEDGRDLYERWLSKGDVIITIEKGIHQTKDDRRPHFTIRVGSRAFHAYIDNEPIRYTIVSKSGKIHEISKPVVFSVTEMYGRSSPTRGRSSKQKTFRKATRAGTKARFRPSILPLLDVENEPPL